MLTIILVVVGLLVLVEVLALVRLKMRVDSFTTYWKNQNQAAQGDLLFVALGDSAAQGLGASEPEKGYVGLLAKALAKNNASVKTVNLSVSGAKIADVTRVQIPQLNQLGVNAQTIITMDIGGNEMRAFNEESFRNDMDELMQQLPKQTIVAEVPYFGGGRYRKYEPNVPIANTIIHELASTYGFKTAPLYEITKSRDSLKTYAPDLFHPSNTGYKNWADAFKQALELK